MESFLSNEQSTMLNPTCSSIMSKQAVPLDYRSSSSHDRLRFLEREEGMENSEYESQFWPGIWILTRRESFAYLRVSEHRGTWKGWWGLQAISLSFRNFSIIPIHFAYWFPSGSARTDSHPRKLLGIFLLGRGGGSPRVFYAHFLTTPPFQPWSTRLEQTRGKRRWECEHLGWDSYEWS